ncbi:MAG: hypothetical protein ABI134_30900 [Byssovorax sp.]
MPELDLRRAGDNARVIGQHRNNSFLGNPQVLATTEGNGARLALDEDSVYFTDPSAGVVRRMPKIGGQPATIAAMQSRPSGMAVDAWCVYWAHGGSGTSDGSVMKAPK